MKNKKNVLIFLNSFWNNGKGMSGGDQMFIQVFKRIRDSFDKVYIYTNTDGETVVNNGGLLNVKLKISNKMFDKYNIFINYVFRTVKAFSCLKIKDINIIYSTSDFFPDVVPAYLYRVFNKNTKWFQCVFHVYPDWRNRPGSKIKSFIAGYLQKISFILIKKADCIVNINKQVGDYLIENGFDKSKIIVNTPGIDVEYFEHLTLKDNVEKYDATFLARLNPSKGINDLIDIWALVVGRNKNAKLAIIGGGSEEIKNMLKQKIINTDLVDNIKIIGFLEDNDAFSLIKNSKVFIFPSHEEGFGIAIAEAMACNVPVVSWDLPVYNEIFESNLVQIKENDVKCFAEKVVGLLEDNAERTRISGIAKIFVKKYDWSSISERHLEIINKFDS
ncbi:MAG: hypothetical protein A2452_02230 [Candidatus Firestonebacteria bacterium RIFOXYC2_FULL_39_67]|nr:MAG: hypothetical protein A2452_02230 [Candidatus Firestonebacteria bacterium RIFOXYC2_FULL_39_67]